jgi:glycosyltransferase involved in cell wall biosynthesis
MTPDRRIAFVVPDDLDRPVRPTGGTEYDRRLVAGLRGEGWAVEVRPVAAPWTDGKAMAGEVADVLAHLADGSVALVDGLLAAPAAGVFAAHAARLRLVLLMHMSMAVAPPGHGGPGAAAAERSVLRVAAAVVASSEWLRQQIVTGHDVTPQRVSAAPPGAESAPATPPSPAGDRLLCVAPVAPHKGHDVLVDALARLPGLSWTCRCVGSLDTEPDFVAAVRRAAQAHGLGDRIAFAGVRSRSELADDYAASDLLVLPTRSESYGMVLTEALSRGLPVVASDVGGVGEAATGTAPSAGSSVAVPGALVPPDDPDALADALRLWLTDVRTRSEWRRRALQRRLQLPGWDVTARRVASAIARASSPCPS